MEQIVDFPNPRTYPYPDELRLPDGTLLIGKTWGESPLIMNRKTWSLYTTYVRLDNDPNNPRPILKSTQNGVVYRLPDEGALQEILGYVKENPGATVEEVLGYIFARYHEEGADLSNERVFLTIASFVFDIISLLAIYGLLYIAK